MAAVRKVAKNQEIEVVEPVVAAEMEVEGFVALSDEEAQQKKKYH